MRDYTTDKYKARKGLYKTNTKHNEPMIRPITLPKLKWMENGNDDSDVRNTDTKQEFRGEDERGA
jgi:hypothetical protein